MVVEIVKRCCCSYSSSSLKKNHPHFSVDSPRERHEELLRGALIYTAYRCNQSSPSALDTLASIRQQLEQYSVQTSSSATTTNAPRYISIAAGNRFWFNRLTAALAPPPRLLVHLRLSQQYSLLRSSKKVSDPVSLLRALNAISSSTAFKLKHNCPVTDEAPPPLLL